MLLFSLTWNTATSVSKVVVHVSKETEEKSVSWSRNSIHRVGESPSSVVSQKAGLEMKGSPVVSPENGVLQSMVPEMTTLFGGGGQANRENKSYYIVFKYFGVRFCFHTCFTLISSHITTSCSRDTSVTTAVNAYTVCSQDTVVKLNVMGPPLAIRVAIAGSSTLLWKK